MGEHIPGLITLCVVAAATHIVVLIVPEASQLLIAIFLGAAIANLAGVPTRLRAGLSSHKLLLEIGIVLMGVQLSLGTIARTGPVLVVLALGTISFGILLVESVSRLLTGSASKTMSLIAAGASVCGVSAVVAVAGSIDADEEQIAYAVGTVLLLDAMTLVLYPIAGDILGLPAKNFGIWAGLSMFSTGPVTAVGFAYADAAGRWATLTKILRNTFIGLVAIGYSLYWARETRAGSSRQVTALWENLPKFLVGFLAVVVVANAVPLSESTMSTIDTVSEWCFLLAFAGLGFDIRLDGLQAVGVKPLVVVGIYLVTVSLLTLGLVTILF